MKTPAKKQKRQKPKMDLREIYQNAAVAWKNSLSSWLQEYLRLPWAWPLSLDMQREMFAPWPNAWPAPF